MQKRPSVDVCGQYAYIVRHWRVFLVAIGLGVLVIVFAILATAFPASSGD